MHVPRAAGAPGRVRDSFRLLCGRLARATGWRLPWSTPPASAERPLERLVSDLHRLEAEFRRTEQARVPYRAARLEALSLAYDCTLLDCCRLLEVEPPGRPPWTPVDRLGVECGLALAGLVW